MGERGEQTCERCGATVETFRGIWAHTCPTSSEGKRPWFAQRINDLLAERDELASEVERLQGAIPLLQWIRGMCSDEEPHEKIDVKVAEAISLLHPDEPKEG